MGFAQILVQEVLRMGKMGLNPSVLFDIIFWLSTDINPFNFS